MFNETKAFNYEKHLCKGVIKGSKYIYTHGENNTVDILNPSDLSHVKTLDTDGNCIFFGLEMN